MMRMQQTQQKHRVCAIIGLRSIMPNDRLEDRSASQDLNHDVMSDAKSVQSGIRLKHSELAFTNQ